MLNGIHWRRTIGPLALVAALASPASSAVPYSSGILDFNVAGANMWGPGSAYMLDEVEFVGFDPPFVSSKAGGITGSVSTTHIPCVPTGFGCFPGTGIDVTTDTRTGAELRTSIDAKVGFNFGAKIDSGSVDVNYPAEVTFQIPDNLKTGVPFNLSPATQLGPGAQMTTQFSNLETFVDLVLDLSPASVGATACVTFLGCDGGDVPVGVNPPDLEVLSYNRNQNGVLKVLGTDELINNFGEPIDISRQIPPPPSPGVSQSLGDVTIFTPNLATSGAPGTNGDISSNGSADVLQLGLDMDAVLSFGFPALALTGLSASAGPFSIGYDLLDWDAGPFFALTQDFLFDPTLMVQLDFNTFVDVEGLGPVTQVIAPVDAIPNMTLLSRNVMVSPTFFLDNMFTNKTGFDIDPFMELSLLCANASFDVGIFSFGVLDICAQQFPFRSNGPNVNVLDSTFALNFAQIAASPFFIRSVPEPSTVLLIMAGLVGLAYSRWMRTSRGREPIVEGRRFRGLQSRTI